MTKTALDLFYTEYKKLPTTAWNDSSATDPSLHYAEKLYDDKQAC